VQLSQGSLAISYPFPARRIVEIIWQNWSACRCTKGHKALILDDFRMAKNEFDF
jgi:hypothetical protein